MCAESYTPTPSTPPHIDPTPLPPVSGSPPESPDASMARKLGSGRRELPRGVRGGREGRDGACGGWPEGVLGVGV